MSNTKDKFEFSAGYTVEASPSSIAFLWSNWEVLYTLESSRISATKIDEDAWEASGFFGHGEFHLVNRDITTQKGEFEYYTFASFLGSSRFRANTTMKYNKISDNKISYHGCTEMTIPFKFSPLRWLLKNMAKRAGIHINKVGGEAAREITNNPTLIRKKVGKDSYEQYKEYINEEKAMRRDPEANNLKHFEKERDYHDQETDIEKLESQLSKLELKIDKNQEPVRVDEFKKSLTVFGKDPEMALVKNRKIIEHIAKDVFEKELDMPSGTRMLGQLIDQIKKDANNVPSRITALMRTVSLLGNTGAHVDEFQGSDSPIDTSEFSVSFNATIRVTEWYFSEFLVLHDDQSS